MDLCVLVLNKCNGMKLENSAVVDRLVEYRTVLEKMRPINEKLKYQIDKLVNISKAETNNADNPLSLKPKPENLDFDEDHDDDNSDEDGDIDDVESEEEKTENTKSTVKKRNVYVPPKVAAVRYDGDETLMERNKKLLDRAKKRALSSNLIQELKGEFDEGPEEIADHNFGRRKHNKEFTERKKYEEDYFTRLNIKKKKDSRNLVTVSSLSDEITKFDDISALDIQDVEQFKAKKRKKVSEKKKVSRKKFKKFKKK
ncbi:neuroguidin-like isoform X1 [Leptotrombidium deliense]|uniref:Neuroguidin-like isoform X1 n=1 Tax=Leptotrombidium deliense TaxID=299467 RepID=A0A443SD56_9ACAR|nr:neuroguidin-like isoform X1 [Leptotrombidium deliense]